MAYIEKRETKSGNVRYRDLIRLKGFPTQSATFRTKTLAKRWAQATDSAIREGRHFKMQEAKRHTLADLVWCQPAFPNQ